MIINVAKSKHALVNHAYTIFRTNDFNIYEPFQCNSDCIAHKNPMTSSRRDGIHIFNEFYGHDTAFIYIHFTVSNGS
jgi:hypothetical protein